MNSEHKENLNGKVEVPAWVMLIQYVLSWTFGVSLVAAMLTGWIEYRILLLALAVYLLFWPVAPVGPAELIRRIFPQ